MKRIHKSIIATMICLSLAIALISVPTSAGSDYPVSETFKLGDVVPGELKVTLREQYYTVDDDEYGSLAEILPEIEIESYLDQYLCVLNDAQKQTIREKDPEYADMIGKNFHIKLVDKSVEAVERAINALKENRFVKRVAPNYCGDVDATPNDPYYAPGTGTPQWGLPKIGAPEAWDYITGSDMTDGSELDDYVKVAIIDTGVDDQHPDLVDNLDMSLAYNSYYDTYGDTFDTHSHGTHVAGIIGAVGNNQIGVSGVCWHVDMVPIKVMSDSNTTNSAALQRAINYAKNNDIYIANVSLNISLFDDDVITAVRLYSNAGGLLIKSAGNDGVNINSNPAFIDLSDISGVIIVGGLDYNMSGDYPYYGNNYGYNFGDEVVDLFAPGVSIMSTVPNNGYSTKSGTSMAAPFVTGTAALIKSANTGYTNTLIKKRIRDNVVTSSSLTNYCNTGGRLNIPDALYDMGYNISISNTMTHGTVRPSAVFSKPNTIVYLTAYPDAGYMLKPGTMKHNLTNTFQISKWRCFFGMDYVDEVITAQFYLVGDVDLDGAVTLMDSLEALRHYSGLNTLTGDAFLAADVDGDGDVDLTDAQTIQSYAAHLIDHFPIEE